MTPRLPQVNRRMVYWRPAYQELVVGEPQRRTDFTFDNDTVQVRLDTYTITFDDEINTT